jgi:sodium transport system permease protein
LPAVCEELAFRGFILSGFRRVGRNWQAIACSTVFFALAHGVVQQSLIACLLGVVLGYLAIQSGSILPGMVFHAVHNTLALANSRVTAEMIPNIPLLRKFVAPGEGAGCRFEWPAVVVATLIGVLVLMRFGRLDRKNAPQDGPNKAIERGEEESMPLAPEKAAC